MNQKTQHHDLTIVVNTCDAYHDVLKIFFHALRDYWSDCSYPVVINTESNTHTYPARVHTYRSGTGVDDWGDRLRFTLESIDTEFVLMVYDDFILDGPVDSQSVQAALCLLKSQPKAVVTYLTDTSLPLVSNNAESLFIPLRDKIDYRLNSAPAIWRKQALMGYTVAGDTPWAWEVFGTYRTWGDGYVFYALNPLKSNIYSYNHSKGGAIYRGKWVREVVDQVAHKYPLEIDWSQRGFSSDTDFEKRSVMWKVRFMLKGYNMVGYKFTYFIFLYIRSKLHAAK
ncbi:hypothetical protein B6A14_03220 [Polynucleobacter hirudinilacicola]|uniref:Glycosyltransferase 2-like domain-containing protein n=1 Tax=Polynucleobacter hirudinilacicola TaxID=1743166 RepID=A0A210RZ15_9BURK|nr:hypothetical protein [Polynucleobacter hirudinilacicola]OWF66222.1 hypothetical protein B6A14_03220 [Polynucleobacter hirudinilacicola]